MQSFFVLAEKGSCAAARLAHIRSTKRIVEGEEIIGKEVGSKTVRSLLAHCDQRGEVAPDLPLPFRFFAQEVASHRLSPLPDAPWKEVGGPDNKKTRQKISALVNYQPKKNARSAPEPLVMAMAQQLA
jgi:hypothetical protein